MNECVFKQSIGSLVLGHWFPRPLVPPRTLVPGTLVPLGHWSLGHWFPQKKLPLGH